MDSDKSKILVIVEGEKTDYRLMNRLLQLYGISDSHEIVSYNTNIYTLYNEMFRDGDPDSIDLLQNLKEHETDPEKKKLFDERYSDILLILIWIRKTLCFRRKRFLKCLLILLSLPIWVSCI